MLLALWPYRAMPLDQAVRRRLECLESRLRRASENRVSVGRYATWLAQDHLPPVSRVTLRQDFLRYAEIYDDVVYDGRRRLLYLDPDADSDARRWLMGYAWGEHPLRPKLSSSVVRCLLQAQLAGAEVEFQYLSVSGTSFAQWTGIPVGLVGGQDSAYLRLWLPDGHVWTFDLARIHGSVRWTNTHHAPYPAMEDDPIHVMTVSVSDADLLARLTNQFVGFRRLDTFSAELRLPRSLLLMTANLIEAWLRRHSPVLPSSRRVPERDVKLNGGTRLRIEVRSP